MTDISSGESGDISADLLIGAAAISVFFFGTPDRRRSVYHLAATSNMPHSKIGGQLCSTRSALREWIRPKGKKT